MHHGECLRGVLHITDYEVPKRPDIKVLANSKVFGGYLKTVKHWSDCNNCYMTFNIFLPEDDVNRQRCEPFPALYFLAGLTSSHENGPFKSGYAPYAKKHGLAIIFPDTSPRDIADYPSNHEAFKIDDPWRVGYGSGHYCNATQEPWKKNFNMYTYITEELPKFVETYFHVSSKKSIMGHSMGGNGAVMITARNPTAFKSFSAFAPICAATHTESYYSAPALTAYFGSLEAAREFDGSEVIRSKGKGFKLPNGLVDFGTADPSNKSLMPQNLIDALGSNGHTNVTCRW